MATSRFLFLTVIAATAAVLNAVDNDACPPDNDISPCTCDGEGVNCMGAVSADQVRRAFRARFKYGGVRSMWIQSTRVTQVTADLFNDIKVQEAFIELNNLTSFDLASLSGSKNTLFIFSLFGNGLTTFDFAGLNNFQIIGTLNLGKNKLTTIPDNAIQARPLRNIILAQNEISSIGANAFANAPSLTKVELSQNRLVTLGPRSFVMTSNRPLISLVSNQITTIDSTAFENTTPQLVRLSANRLSHLKKEAFENLATKMGQIGGIIEVYSNPFSCRGCDYGWLVDKKVVLERLFLGFYCQTGGNLGSLTKQKIGC